MDNNITVTEGHSFNMNYSDETGSTRTDAASSVGSPRRLRVMHSAYVDSSSKLAGRRHVVRFERDVIDTVSGKTATVAMQFTAQVPLVGSIDNATVSGEFAFLKALLSVSDIEQAIVINQEQ